MHFSFHPRCVTVLAILVFINYPNTGWRSVSRSWSWCVKPGVLTGLIFSDVTPCILAVTYEYFRGIVCLHLPQWRRRFHKIIYEYLPDNHNLENNYFCTAYNFTLFQAKYFVFYCLSVPGILYVTYTAVASARCEYKAVYVVVRNCW